MEAVCARCFSPTDKDNICKSCGFSNEYELLQRSGSRALPLMNVLNGRYLLGQVLGEGGFGITYVALDMQSRRRVAVKEYFPSEICKRGDRGELKPVRNPDSFKRGVEHFYDEAQILQKLSRCPSVVNVEGFFKQNSTAYLVMELLEGESVKGFARHYGDRIPYQQAKYITLQIALALSEVHLLGIIHSDISLSNIYIMPNGDVKLIDFGASRNFLQRGGDFTTQLKPGYAPPEQYDGKGDKLGPWSDIYALACTFCRMVTGRTVPSAAQRANGAPIPDIRSVPGIEPRAIAAIEKALALDYRQRYHSTDEFIMDFSDYTEKRTDEAVQHDMNAAEAVKKLWSRLAQAVNIEKNHPANAYVQVIVGKVPGMTRSLADGQILRIGRQADMCDLVVSDAPVVSRVHCVAVYDRKSGRITLYDKSSNGVRLDDGTELRGGSIQLNRDTSVYLSGGHVVLRFVLHGR